MTTTVRSGKSVRLVLLLFLCIVSSYSHALASPAPGREENGRSPYVLADFPFQVRSWEKDGLLVAEIDGLLDYPFSRIAGALTRPEAWCEFIPLVFNIKSCTHEERQERTLLTLYIGRKFYDPPEDALRLVYRFQVREQDPNRFRVDLLAPEGPHGTRDYRIEVEARSCADGRTAIRMHSSFRPSLRSDLATRAYLATLGQGKVGFSVRGEEGNRPVYVGGVKGIVERNAMRYYLALKAFLDTIDLPVGKRFEARLHAWYSMTEIYRRQLYEMERKVYLDTKRDERKNQLRLQQQLRRGPDRA